MSRKNKMELLENQKSIHKRILNSTEWEAKKNTLSTEWLTLKEKRHENILAFGEFSNMHDDVNVAQQMAQNKVAKIIEMPKAHIEALDNRYIYDELNLSLINAKESDKMIALKNAQDSILLANHNQIKNSAYTYNNQIASGINASYSSTIIDPYEAQVLFETTSLGYQGVMIPINDAFSTTFRIVSKFLSFYDEEAISKYLVEKNVMNLVKTAVIDAQVYGGGILTPVFKFKNNPQLLKDLSGDIYKYFGIDDFSLDTLMCFDRYCTIPNLNNDGLYSMKLWTTLPMNLTTIFEEGDLQDGWYARFSPDTTSRCKFIRPDGFGISIFARANKSVYNYEQQIQFLNYALGQLSIIVFNSKSQDYMNGGSADHTWDSPIGGQQLNDIRSQLSAMQQSMNIERGLYLNDIEVTALNRTFTGVDSIINAMNSQASMAFGIRRDILFGEVKSSLGYKEDSKTTPLMLQMREKFRTPILQVLKWCIFGYFAENGWRKINDKGEIIRWDKNEFIAMMKSLDVAYGDNIKTNDDILKEYGALDITKLVEARLMRTSSAIHYLSDIPILNKAYNTESKEFVEWVNNIDNLQDVGIKADKVEQEAITAINEAILKKKDVLSPAQNLNKLENNENLMYNLDSASQKPLEDFGDIDENGIVQPRSVDKRKTKKEVTQKLRKQRSHE